MTEQTQPSGGATTRVPLKNGTDWLELRNEITYGEDLDILDGSQVNGVFSLRAHGIARICAWVADWSLPSLITPESIAALKPAMGREMASLVAAHVDRLERDDGEAEGTDQGEGEAPGSGADQSA
jgi:hypothetical protein